MQKQTWLIDGRHFNREQLELYKRELAGEFVVREEDLKPKVKEVVERKGKKKGDKVHRDTLVSKKELEEEFKELKSKKAWLFPDLKLRYNEVKGMLGRK